MTTRLVNVVIDALDLRGLTQFWADALEWRINEKYFEDDEGVIEATDGSNLEVICGPTTTRKTVKNRVHFDLATRSTEDRQALIERLIRMGASEIDIGQPADATWTVFADPEGNEFCVIDPIDENAASRLSAIAFDAADPRSQAAFWAAATGWVTELEAEWGTALRDPSGRGPALIFGPPVAPKEGKLRIHLDVAPPVGGSIDEEVDRLLALGARRADIGQGDEVPWTVLADPEDNEFCVLTPR